MVNHPHPDDYILFYFYCYESLGFPHTQLLYHSPHSTAFIFLSTSVSFYFPFSYHYFMNQHNISIDFKYPVILDSCPQNESWQLLQSYIHNLSYSSAFVSALKLLHYLHNLGNYFPENNWLNFNQFIITSGSVPFLVFHQRVVSLLGGLVTEIVFYDSSII